MNSELILYECDPNKNAECRKTGCVHNPNSVYPTCNMTAKKECSVNGTPYLVDITDDECNYTALNPDDVIIGDDGRLIRKRPQAESE